MAEPRPRAHPTRRPKGTRSPKAPRGTINNNNFLTTPKAIRGTPKALRGTTTQQLPPTPKALEAQSEEKSMVPGRSFFYFVGPPIFEQVGKNCMARGGLGKKHVGITPDATKTKTQACLTRGGHDF